MAKIEKETKLITHYLLILDKSSSMSTVQQNTISGFNENIQTIKKLAKDNLDQEFYVSLVTFNGEVDYAIWEKPLDEIELINEKTYSPDGMTALYDAIGLSITKLQKDIKEELESESDSKIVVTIFTDGMENASQECNHEFVANLSEELQKTEKWMFSYIGANHDVQKTAKSLNIPMSNTIKYCSSQVGTASAFASQTEGLNRYVATRGAGIKDINHLYSDEDKMLDISEEE